MKFSATEDIEAPIDHVYREVTNFAGFERQALRRGASVNRLDGQGPIGTGSSWDVGFKFRGKARRMTATIGVMDPPNSVRVDTVAGGLDGVTQIELLALSRSHTRISVQIELLPKSLSARLVLQSLKLAKSNLTKRFKAKITEFSEDIEERYTKPL